MIQTKEKILDSAEKLFAENGFAATSLREIIADAGVNLAAIHYHFGTKEDLLDEVILRRIRPVNDQRAARLDQLEAQAQGAPVPLESILDAFLAPAAAMAVRHPQWVRIMGRIHVEGMMPAFIQRHPMPLFDRFLDAIRRSVPHLGEEEFRWRVMLMFGAMGHVMAWSKAAGPARRADYGPRLSAVVRFLAAGWMAPAAIAKEANAE